MKNIKSTEDDFFKEIISQSRLSLPFSDFEECVMSEIEDRATIKNNLSKEIKLSWVFFIAGTVCGIVLSSFLVQLHEPIFGINPINITVVFAVVFATVLFSQIDILLKHSKRANSK